MVEKTFIKITNRDIYDSVQGLHTKHDDIKNIVNKHSVQISLLQKITYGIAGFLGSVGTSVIIFLIVTKPWG